MVTFLMVLPSLSGSYWDHAGSFFSALHFPHCFSNVLSNVPLGGLHFICGCHCSHIDKARLCDMEVNRLYFLLFAAVDDATASDADATATTSLVAIVFFPPLLSYFFLPASSHC